MWIPHFGLIPWAASEKELIERSEADRTSRYFYVGFILENCDTRRTRDSTIGLEQEQFKTLSSKGNLKIEIKLIPNDDKHLSVVDTRVTATHYYEAVRKAYNAVTSYLLSIQAFQSGSNCAIWALVVKDDLYKSIWNCIPQHGAANPLNLPVEIGISHEFRAMLALYREARNNPSPYYRFFCSYKILEAFYQRTDVFKRIDKMLKDAGLPANRPKRKITQDDLVHSLLLGRKQDFLDMPYGKFFEYLRSNERIQVAHTFPQDKPFINLDDYDLYTEFACMANLTELVARQLVLDELELHSQLFASGAMPISDEPNITDSEAATETEVKAEGFTPHPFVLQPPPQIIKIMDEGTSNPIVNRMSLQFLEILSARVRIDTTAIQLPAPIIEYLKEAFFLCMQALIEAEKVYKSFVQSEDSAIEFLEHAVGGSSPHKNLPVQLSTMVGSFINHIWKAIEVINDTIRISNVPAAGSPETIAEFPRISSLLEQHKNWIQQTDTLRQDAREQRIEVSPPTIIESDDRSHRKKMSELVTLEIPTREYIKNTLANAFAYCEGVGIAVLEAYLVDGMKILTVPDDQMAQNKGFKYVLIPKNSAS